MLRFISYNNEFYQLITEGGQVINATHNHVFGTENRGYTPTENLTVGDIIFDYAMNTAEITEINIIIYPIHP